ncbi:phospholipase D-like domain-containing anti-phage protein [uncultured Anaerovibrio sp.]|uniref:phospholipase D-like domain-containing anti-phage protein n=1 Tax=uncultured Anaerovibrio sp. TaxID=361586 RepID=UPI00260F6397|nr:phospholipase D-like domain-containing anti-phage protein [uncultured Anaerovibrio sp.]
MRRYSTRRGEIFSEVLERNLKNAQSYDRIAGYFSSSILDIAGEALESVTGKVRLVCNSDLAVEDVKTAKLAKEAMRQEWNEFHPESLPPNGVRFQRLYDFIISGKLEVKVLPKEKFGLEHGKAGVFTKADGSRTSFMGSANSTLSGWKANYELVWEDDSEETVKWVQEEFDSLWNNPFAVPLADYIVEDIKRIKDRTVYTSIEEWKEQESDAAAVTVESPIYRQSFGLWEHQKYFVDKVFSDHKKSYGARYVLADQVGLGKTVQLAVSAELMALYGEKPILIIVPKTLLEQWQDELYELMGIPSAIWKKAWFDEKGIEYPLPITKCPRRIGIISQGIISNGSAACCELKEALLNQSYECVVVDEAHRARRRNLSEQKLKQSPEMNNLYSFLMAASRKTHSMLLATATPVQMFPIEAFDLLNILSQKNDSVLGGSSSKWRTPNESILQGLDYITGDRQVNDNNEAWLWVKNPFPPADEDPRTFGDMRRRTEMSEDDFICKKLLSEFTPPDRKKAEKIIKADYFGIANPYIRHIIRRERSYLENTINPETNQPYLQKVEVKLLGESDSEALILEGYLGEAYKCAEDFCKMIQKRSPAAGLFKTLLLKRIGSSMIAGLNTGNKILNEWKCIDEALFFEDEDDDEEDNEGKERNASGSNKLKELTSEELDVLQKFVANLKLVLTNEHMDPKYDKVLEILERGMQIEGTIKTPPWKDLGCIIFSQYYDTVDWVARSLSNHFDEPIGVYAGGSKSGIYRKGQFQSEEKTDIKLMVKERKLKILIGTDAASEGLNLQTLGTLINLDLPWNPTRLEQRKGRIQRIGQQYDTVYICNLRYKGSVEDRVHKLLSDRMESIYKMFGQLPDVLKDVWVDVAVGNIEEAKKRINDIPDKHPFEIKYKDQVKHIDWESCAHILDQKDIYEKLLKQW